MAVLEERARRAEQTREEEARRRVAEERLRIARELHDVVAHHIALINVQAGVAGHLLDRPGRRGGRRSATSGRPAGRCWRSSATLLGVLRRPGDDGRPDRAGARASPGWTGCVESFARRGPDRALAPSGQPRPLPAAVDVAAYRIVQESLTNVRKHAGASSPSACARRADRVEVRDEARHAGSAAVHGLRRPSGGPEDAVGGHGIWHAGAGDRRRRTLGAGAADPAAVSWVHAELPAAGGGTDDDPGAAGRRPGADPRRLPGAHRLGAATWRWWVRRRPGAEAVELARSTRADVVLMDIRMPGLDGLAATREITADEDLAGVRVLMLTTFEIDEYVFQALRAGASGFLGKGVEPAELLDAIRVVAARRGVAVAEGHPA